MPRLGVSPSAEGLAQIVAHVRASFLLHKAGNVGPSQSANTDLGGGA